MLFIYDTFNDVSILIEADNFDKEFYIHGALPKSGKLSISIFRYIASAKSCWRPKKSDASSKQSYSSKSAMMLKPNAEYNRRAVIIEGLRAGRSAMEIIRFFGYSRQPFIML